MPNSRMVPETLEQAQARLRAMSDAEKAGVQSIAQGQLIATRGVAAEEGSLEADLHRRIDAERIRPAANDRVDDSAVKAGAQGDPECPLERESAAGKAAGKTSGKGRRKKAPATEAPAETEKTKTEEAEKTEKPGASEQVSSPVEQPQRASRSARRYADRQLKPGRRSGGYATKG